MKPILKIVTEWMSTLRDAGIDPSVDVVRACVRKQLIDAGDHMRLDELDLHYPSEEVAKRRTYNALVENGVIKPTDTLSESDS